MRLRAALRTAIATVAGIALPAGAAHALDYRSVAETAVLFDAPSAKAKPLYVIAAGTPVEAVVALDTWVKVRDMKGDLVWIERRLLSERRMLQVRNAVAQVRANPEENASVVFSAEPDVLLELIEPAGTGWVKVRHRSGQEGFVKTAQVWGW